MFHGFLARKAKPHASAKFECTSCSDQVRQRRASVDAHSQASSSQVVQALAEAAYLALANIVIRTQSAVKVFDSLLFDREVWDAALSSHLARKLGVDTSHLVSAACDLHSIEINSSSSSAPVGQPRALSFVLRALQGSSIAAVGNGLSVCFASIVDDAGLGDIGDMHASPGVCVVTTVESSNAPQVRHFVISRACLRCWCCCFDCFARSVCCWSSRSRDAVFMQQELELDEFNASPVMMAMLRVIDVM